MEKLATGADTARCGAISQVSQFLVVTPLQARTGPFPVRGFSVATISTELQCKAVSKLRRPFLSFPSVRAG